MAELISTLYQPAAMDRGSIRIRSRTAPAIAPGDLIRFKFSNLDQREFGRITQVQDESATHGPGAWIVYLTRDIANTGRIDWPIGAEIHKVTEAEFNELTGTTKDTQADPEPKSDSLTAMFEKAKSWATANPLYAVGIGVGVYLALFSKRRLL